MPPPPQLHGQAIARVILSAATDPLAGPWQGGDFGEALGQWQTSAEAGAGRQGVSATVVSFLATDLTLLGVKADPNALGR